MKKITALVLAIIMTAAFTGCAPKEEPAAIEEPQATPEPEPQEVESTIEQNPVSAFYAGYKSATEAMEALFRSRLEDDKSCFTLRITTCGYRRATPPSAGCSPRIRRISSLHL